MLNQSTQTCPVLSGYFPALLYEAPGYGGNFSVKKKKVYFLIIDAVCFFLEMHVHALCFLCHYDTHSRQGANVTWL